MKISRENAKAIGNCVLILMVTLTAIYIYNMLSSMRPLTMGDAFAIGGNLLIGVVAFGVSRVIDFTGLFTPKTVKVKESDRPVTAGPDYAESRTEIPQPTKPPKFKVWTPDSIVGFAEDKIEELNDELLKAELRVKGLVEGHRIALEEHAVKVQGIKRKIQDWTRFLPPEPKLTIDEAVDKPQDPEGNEDEE